MGKKREEAKAAAGEHIDKLTNKDYEVKGTKKSMRDFFKRQRKVEVETEDSEYTVIVDKDGDVTNTIEK